MKKSQCNEEQIVAPSKKREAAEDGEAMPGCMGWTAGTRISGGRSGAHSARLVDTAMSWMNRIEGIEGV